MGVGGEMCGCLGGRWCQVGDRHFAHGKYRDLEKKSLLNIGILNKKKSPAEYWDFEPKFPKSQT